MIISFSSKNFTLSHTTVVSGSKLFSSEGSISPILQEEKKLVVHAVQKTCLAYFPQVRLLILWPSMMRRSKVIAILVGLAATFASVEFLTPLIAILIQLSELRLTELELLSA